MIEKAIAVESLLQLKKAQTKGFQRLYFGSETCERKIPSPQELEKALALAQKQNLKFSLLTPFCTDAGIKKIKALLPALSPKDELIVNDFGVLCISKECKPEPVAGRLLNKQFRDPRIPSLKGKFPEELVRHLSLSNASLPKFRKILSQFEVRRFELDNLLQGIGTSLAGTKFSASLYHPFALISATRMCIPANCGKISQNQSIGVLSCSKECLSFKFKLSHKAFPKPLYIIGNALFFENTALPPEPELAEKGINRIVTNSPLLQ